MISCLYASDYGAAHPLFDAVAQGLVAPEAPHAAELARAQNLGQFEAMQRKLARGESIQWCDQGYAWVYQPVTDGFFGLALILLVFPYLAKRLWSWRLHFRSATALPGDMG